MSAHTRVVRIQRRTARDTSRTNGDLVLHSLVPIRVLAFGIPLTHRRPLYGQVPLDQPIPQAGHRRDFALSLARACGRIFLLQLVELFPECIIPGEQSDRRPNTRCERYTPIHKGALASEQMLYLQKGGDLLQNRSQGTAIGGAICLAIVKILDRSRNQKRSPFKLTGRPRSAAQRRVRPGLLSHPYDTPGPRR
jgi:hypothetical protein